MWRQLECRCQVLSAMASLGGDVTVDVPPEAGIRGNGHTLMLEKNNKVIMNRMISWLKDYVPSRD